MSDLFSRLLALVVLRLGPQDLPAGASPLVLAIVLYIAASSLSMAIGQPPEHAVAVMALAALLPLLLVRIVLILAQKAGRWVQTLTALFGSSAVLTIASLPLATVAGREEPPLIAALASLAFFIWSFIVDAHIWRHALEVRFITGLAVAMVLFAVTLFTINSLAGPL